MENLQYVSNFSSEGFCENECVWYFEPGTHCSYSSTNYVLMGLILASHAPEGQRTWDSYDMFEGLGLNKKDFPNTYFPAKGPTY